MAIYEFEGNRPIVGKGCFVHPEAVIIGDVTIGRNCYIGAGACIRGDWGKIVIGDDSNIQENCVIHVLVNGVVTLGNRSHIGHGSILHSTTLGEHVYVGMGSIILDLSEIGDGCVVGAGSLITENKIFPPRQLILGFPAKIVGEVTQSMKTRMEMSTGYYIKLPNRCNNGLLEIPYKHKNKEGKLK